jgi:hypothetical protein
MTLLRIVIPLRALCLNMIFSESRATLCANAALRVQVMPYAWIFAISSCAHFTASCAGMP